MTYEHIRDDIHRAIKQSLLMIDSIETAHYSPEITTTEQYLEIADRFLESVHSHLQGALNTIKREKERRKG